MSESMREMSSMEREFTAGKEKETAKKVEETAKIVIASGILREPYPEKLLNLGSDDVYVKDEREEERERMADKVVEFASDGVFASYKDLVHASCDPNKDKEQVDKTFRVLTGAISLAANSGGDQELQTRLYTGGIKDVLPKPYLYDNKGASKLDVVSGVMSVTITNPKIMEVYKEVSDIRDSYDFSDPVERDYAAEEILKQRQKLLGLRKEIPADQMDLWKQSKEYLAMSVAVLDGSYRVGDGAGKKEGNDSVDSADEVAVLGKEVAQALRENARATQENARATRANTEATEQNTEAIFDLNKALEGFTTVIQMETLSRLKDRGVEVEGLTDQVVKSLQREVDDPANFEKYDGEDKMLRMQKAGQLKIALKIAEGVRLMKAESTRGRWEPKTEIPGNRETWDGTIDELYAWLDSIEKGTRSVDDLSTNATKFGYLYRLQNGDYDEYFKGLIETTGLKYGDREVTVEDLGLLKNEVAMRLFLHSFNLAASKCSTIEDIMRVVSSMHEGDIDDSLDKLLLSTFLDCKRKGTGLSGTPVDMAWDLRQRGYFKIEELLSEIDKTGEFKHYLHNIDEKDRPDLFRLYKDIMAKGGFTSLLELGDPEIEKSEQFGVENVYQNFFGYEKGGGIKGKLIQEYMVWKIMNEKKCSEDMARKAFDLAHKLSVATFMDSSANLAFAQDDYAEIVNFKFLRICDGPGGKKGRMSKSKPVGHRDTISYVNSLTCQWLYLLRNSYETNSDGSIVVDANGRKKKRALTTTYSPIYSKDFDFSKYKSTTALPYHIFGVVGSQVVFVKEAYFDKFTPKDARAPNALNKTFAKINKTTYDMCRAGIMPIYAQDMSFYEGLDSDDSLIRGRAEARVAEKMRKAWLMNVFRMASMDTTGWTSDQLEGFIADLRYNSTIMEDDEKRPGYKKGTSFISINELESAIKVTRVREHVARLDLRRENDK